MTLSRICLSTLELLSALGTHRRHFVHIWPRNVALSLEKILWEKASITQEKRKYKKANTTEITTKKHHKNYEINA